jgi:ABC-type phosphate/phosphonate transport system substrate-binding protein/rhodanese-related sulfurtransferase
MKRWHRLRHALLGLVVATMAGLSSAQAAELVLNVTLDYDQERNHVGTQAVFNDLAKSLSSSLGQPVKLVLTQNAERVGERIRTGSLQMLIAPAQLVGLAMRNGYTPVAKTEQHARVVLVAAKGVNVKSLETAKGKRIALPHAESLVSYMVKGEMNALGLSANSHFGQVMHMNEYGAVTYAMEIGQSDVAGMKEDIAKAWIARSPGAQIVKVLADVPAAGVVVSDKLDEGLRQKIRNAFTKLDKGLEGRLVKVGLGTLDPADKPDFEHVSTRGFFTPEVLPGATIPTAEQVKQLMAQGVPLIDVRPLAHRRAGYIPGSISVPYELNSPKDVEYDDAVDRFDLTKLPQDKNAPMIFQCNGAECWFSYKAARYMVKRGFKKVYWFRTGLPAWKGAGYEVKTGG